jgi:quercetin dioxygenase-like cupin family protein
MINKLDKVVSNEIIPGFFGKFFHGKQMTIAFWKVKKGSKIPEHNHIHEQCLFVKKGVFELIIEKEKKILKKNELIIIPSNTKHSGVAITNCELIDVFSPNRKEYSNI